MTDGMPLAVTVRGITVETPSVRTISFDHSFSFDPGQFVMVWIPGIDEVPMALSSSSTITVQEVGEATRALTSLEPGARIGIRGPFGNGFPVVKNTLAIAGGVGAAPLLPLVRAGAVGSFVLGAKTAGELLFKDIIEDTTDLHIATDDGTAGRKGFAIDAVRSLDVGEYSQVCVCGPERMMRGILDYLRERDLVSRGKFSLHRYMKCGSGVCGSCCIDPSGLRVCRDGPVFSGEQLAESELGRHSRDGSGRKIPV